MQSIELLTLGLKLAPLNRKVAVLVSAGSVDDKAHLLEPLRQLSEHAHVWATEGTAAYLKSHGVDALETKRVSEDPNGADPTSIAGLFQARQLDLVINVKRGDADYDERSDAWYIRTQSVSQDLPLLTDAQVAAQVVLKIVSDAHGGRLRYQPGSDQEPWNLRLKFLERVRERGGLAVHHLHLDKAYLINDENLRLGMVDMQKKWELYRHLKRNYTHVDLVERISRGVEKFISQGVTYCRTMVDADSIVGMKPITAALEVKNTYSDRIQMHVGIQPLEGVLDDAAYGQYRDACSMADYCGGLPSRDRPDPLKHLDVIMKTAVELNKPLDVHVDQENCPTETETEMLVMKTREYGLYGRVYAVHAISVACHDLPYQDALARRMMENGVGLITCPGAALSMKPVMGRAPIHNSIAPIETMLRHGVHTYLGIDNIHDLFMPMCDGDVWTECRMLMEACRMYDVDAIADIASTRPTLYGSFLVAPDLDPVALC